MSSPVQPGASRVRRHAAIIAELVIRLHPQTDAAEVDLLCPHCSIRLDVAGWLVPGMRCLAELRCTRCARDFYGDLPAGQGLYTPQLIERETGIVHDAYGVAWFADWMRNSYAERTSEAVEVTTRKATGQPNRAAVLLNCLDTLYGHALLKLLNAQHYLDARTNLDLIVVVQSALAWLVPAGVKETLVVNLPLCDGTQWNEFVAKKIRDAVERYETCYLSPAFSHPSACDFAIERFTGVAPFQLDEWDERAARPTVTFISRDDRLWHDERKTGATRKMTAKIKRKLINRVHSFGEQPSRIVRLAETLRHTLPRLDFAVVGFGVRGGLPKWITDAREKNIDEKIERAWCRRYAESHVVIGVHGSNMLLPSAHAGAVIELVPADRWGNILQDFIVPCLNVPRADARETMFRQRLMPLSTSPEIVAHLADTIIRFYEPMRRLMATEFCRHTPDNDLKNLRSKPHVSRESKF